MKREELDLSPYQDSPYPGRKLIGFGVAIFFLAWISQFAIRWEHAPNEFKTVVLLSFIPATICYLLGYWRAVEGKGYPRVLWLASFTGPIGLLIIMYLPNKRKVELREPVAGGDATR